LKDKGKKIKWRLIALVCGLVVLSMVWILIIRLEGEKPSVEMDLVSKPLGVSREITIAISDAKSGIGRIWIGLIKNHKENTLYEKDFPSGGIFGGGKIHEATVNILIEPKKLDITDGKAILRIAASDLSWRRWWHGNLTYFEKDVVIDTRPPQIDILSRAHNIAQGGAGLVIYRTSESCPESGVLVGKNFFPGYPGFFQDSNVYVAFFALGHSQGKGTAIFIRAADHAGNNTRAGFHYHINRKVFKKDVITISDRFLNWKIPEFNVDLRQDNKISKVEKFLKINRELRKANYQKISEIGGVTANTKYWEGAFLRLPNAARTAGFADHRVYKYKGRIIDNQIHMGVDLASVERAAVPASNDGKVVFADQLGIYGKTVIIDHGFGLFSMYSHLSNFTVKEEQIISKGDQIGYTGRTGLAGGDHLHFAMFIHHTFVNPIEWWDAVWIENNISGKMVAVKTGLGE
jgi:hypothetical protein